MEIVYVYKLANERWRTLNDCDATDFFLSYPAEKTA